jgi:uncharacterized protein (TIGR03067 family)
MRTSTLLLALLACSLAYEVAAAADGADARSKTDRELMQGRWRIVALNRDGRASDGGQLTRLGGSMRFARDAVTQASAGAQAQDGTFTIDPGKRPKTLTIKPKDGGQPQVLIYELDGDRLRLAFQIGDGADPAPDFKPGPGRVVMTLERQHKD